MHFPGVVPRTGTAFGQPLALYGSAIFILLQFLVNVNNIHIMKQLLIRPIQGAPAVLDACYGEIENGQFNPKPLPADCDAVFGHLRTDELLGTQLYFPVMELSDLLHEALDAGSDVIYTPQFLIISFPEDESKEEKK